MNDPTQEDRDAAITMLGYDPTLYGGPIDAALRADQAQAVTLMQSQLISLKEALKREGVPEPHNVMVHPSMAEELRAYFEGMGIPTRSVKENKR